ncbi:MAG: 50S ribosome-binding GTPase, partial [Candidatus Aenigmarchaeota archaeon]|nr:50S ribosome-binding GTPase [Candidatus Aenigmarchaeota archaeon]
KRKKKMFVGVLGYPNVGKSSLINMMKGRRSTGISPLSGKTKAKQVIKTSTTLYFIDTPGVTPYFEKDQLKFMFTNVTDYTKIKDPETMAERLMEKFPGKIEKFYGVSVNEDKRETIEAIAIKKHVLKKGGMPDTKRMAVTIIMKWQRGKL